MKDEPRSLAWRLYTFAALVVVVSVATLLATLVFDGKRPEDDLVPAVEALVSQLEARFPDRAELARALDREPALRRLDLSVYDRRGQRIGGAGAPLDPPTEDELRVVAGAPQLDHRRVVLAMGRDRVWLLRPVGPSSRWIILTLLVVVGVSLAITLVATLVFARTLVRPLQTLGDAARAFGRGETTVRTRLIRRDELGAVGRAFDEMADKIDQLLRTQRAMMADISHELRTPLTRIKLALDLASVDPEAAQHVIDDVDADLEEIEQIIEDVFEMVRLDSAGAAIRRAEVDLVGVVRHSMARFEAYHPSHPIALDTALDHAICQGDGALIRRSLDNLLDNAAKYSAEGSPIALRLRQLADRFEIEVVDHGIGMNSGELALAFTPFWRADGSRARETGGVGLGLALARRIARAHGGDVELQSSRSTGTIARLTLGRGPRIGTSPATATVRNSG
jgi:signal transduction histidine kinase